MPLATPLHVAGSQVTPAHVLADVCSVELAVARSTCELAALLMERAGTGGAVFRNFYRDFLGEAAELLGKSPVLKDARQLFAESATEWTAVAALIEESGRTAKRDPLVDAAARCERIADLEVAAMKKLAAI